MNLELLNRGYAHQRFLDGYHIYVKRTSYTQNHGFLTIGMMQFNTAIAQKGDEYLMAIERGGGGLTAGPFTLEQLLPKLDEYDKKILNGAEKPL